MAAAENSPSQRGDLTALAENLWIVDGTIQMPPGPLPRRMTIARLQTGDLVIFSAIALDEPGMEAIEALGRPAFLVVPNPFHRQDAAAWKARYPQIVVLAPQGAKAAVEEIVPVDQCDGALSDHTVQFQTVPGTGDSESALVVTSAGGTTLVVNDLIGNVQGARGLMKVALWAMGFAGKRPQVPRAYRARAIKDKGAVAGQFRRWATLPNLRRIVISHGAIIEDEPAKVLQALADGLA
jgi:hypothetical protein